MVYKKITMIGTSTQSFEDAVDDAAQRATETLENVHWIDVENLHVEIGSVEEHEYQAEVEVAFALED